MKLPSPLSPALARFVLCALALALAAPVATAHKPGPSHPSVTAHTGPDSALMLLAQAGEAAPRTFDGDGNPADSQRGAPLPSAPAPAAAPADTSAPAPAQSNSEPVTIEVPPPIPVLRQTNDADLWGRIRRGFSMGDLQSELVTSQEQWYATRPDYIQRMTERSSK